MKYDNMPANKLALALEEYEATMGIESLAQMLAASLLACSARSAKSDYVEYPIETDFASGSVVVSLVS